MTTGAINFVYWNGKPAVIKEKEINASRRFLNEHEYVEARPMELKLNQRVRIIKGTLMDKEGKVLELRHKTAKIAIDSLGYILVAYIDRTKLTSALPEWKSNLNYPQSAAFIKRYRNEIHPVFSTACLTALFYLL